MNRETKFEKSVVSNPQLKKEGTNRLVSFASGFFKLSVQPDSLNQPQACQKVGIVTEWSSESLAGLIWTEAMSFKVTFCSWR